MDNIPSRLKEADVNFKETNNWLKGTGLKAETEGLKGLGRWLSMRILGAKFKFSVGDGKFVG